MKRGSEIKKNIFLVLQVLSFRLLYSPLLQTNENVADTIFFHVHRRTFNFSCAEISEVLKTLMNG